MHGRQGWRAHQGGHEPTEGGLAPDTGVASPRPTPGAGPTPRPASSDRRQAAQDASADSSTAAPVITRAAAASSPPPRPSDHRGDVRARLGSRASACHRPSIAVPQSCAASPCGLGGVRAANGGDRWRWSVGEGGEIGEEGGPLRDGPSARRAFEGGTRRVRLGHDRSRQNGEAAVDGAPVGSRCRSDLGDGADGEHHHDTPPRPKGWPPGPLPAPRHVAVGAGVVPRPPRGPYRSSPCRTGAVHSRPRVPGSDRRHHYTRLPCPRAPLLRHLRSTRAPTSAATRRRRLVRRGVRIGVVLFAVVVVLAGRPARLRRIPQPSGHPCRGQRAPGRTPVGSGEHRPGGLDLALRPQTAERRLRALLTGRDRRQQRRGHDPSSRPEAANGLDPLDPEGPVRPQCPQHGAQQDRRRPRSGTRTSRRRHPTGLRDSHPALRRAELRQLPGRRQRTGRRQDVLPHAPLRRGVLAQNLHRRVSPSERLPGSGRRPCPAPPVQTARREDEQPP